MRECQCFADAFAKAFEIDKTRLFGLLGHDGKEVLDPGIPEPHRYRGFHWQEFVDAAELLGAQITVIEATPLLARKTTSVPVYKAGEDELRLVKHISASRGVLYAKVVDFDWHHALFVNHGSIMDLDTGKEYTYAELLSVFTPLVFFKVTNTNAKKEYQPGTAGGSTEKRRCRCKRAADK